MNQQNPAPRPALRRAPDAGIHPAAPVVAPDAAPAVLPAEPMPSDVVRTRPAHLRPVVGLGGSTSDVLRKAPKVEPAPVGKKSASKGGKKKSKLSKKERKRRHRRVKLQVEVPPDVRSKLRKNAKARGTSVDDMVTAVLQGWLDA